MAADAIRLGKLLEEKRRELAALADRVSSYEDREAEYAQTLCTVSRLWERLNSDIRHLADGSLDGPAGAPNQTSSTSSCPFVDRLLQGASASTSKAVIEGQKQLEASLTSVEEALMQRASATQASMANVLQHIKQLHEHNMALSQQMAAQSSDVTLKAEASRLVQDAASTRQQLDHSHAAHRTASERLRAAEDRSLEAEERVKKLQNELADTEQQLSSMQRKFAALKDGQGSEPAVTAAKDTATAAAAAAMAAAASLGDPTMHDDMLEEMQQLQQSLDRRTSELEKERESHFKTKRCSWRQSTDPL